MPKLHIEHRQVQSPSGIMPVYPRSACPQAGDDWGKREEGKQNVTMLLLGKEMSFWTEAEAATTSFAQ